MFCQAGFDQWLTTIMQHLSHLSKPQATVLALWSFGMVLARSCALTAVSQLLAKGMQRKELLLRCFARCKAAFCREREAFLRSEDVDVRVAGPGRQF